MNLSTPHEMLSQLGMKIGARRAVVMWYTIGSRRSPVVPWRKLTPFVQRGRIAQENNSMLHHASEEHE